MISEQFGIIIQEPMILARWKDEHETVGQNFSIDFYVFYQDVLAPYVERGIFGLLPFLGYGSVA